MMFQDRTQAGRELSRRLEEFRGPDTVVVGLPRGGVPVAVEVARALAAPLDVLIVRKVGVPFQPELAMGAIGENGVRVVNADVVRMAQVTPEEFDRVERRERAELDRRVASYRRGRPGLSLDGRTVILVDDGLATGATARAACEVARAHRAARVVLAVPVAARESLEALRGVADQVVCLQAPSPFGAVGQFYADFSAVSDDEVVYLLRHARRDAPSADPPVIDLTDPPDLMDLSDPAGPADSTDPPVRPGFDGEVAVPIDGFVLPGHLRIPAGATGLVVFAHGSGSSRFSTRNRIVAADLNEAGLGTLLLDLLTSEEEVERLNVFDVELLAGRLRAATRWLQARPDCTGLPIGYFGASTGAAAALRAAAEPDSGIAAVVSRGGRPDLAGADLRLVRAPTLLIVGSCDEVVLDLNREAQAQLTCETRLSLVEGATHLFEEPGALAVVADLATDWFRAWLTPEQTARGLLPAAGGARPTR